MNGKATESEKITYLNMVMVHKLQAEVVSLVQVKRIKHLLVDLLAKCFFLQIEEMSVLLRLCISICLSFCA
jgi:hypothetical protein